MPGPFVPLVLGAEILMVASSGPPTVNIQATCRASEMAIIEAFGSDLVTFDQCVSQQNAALEQIKKDWATYPAAAKTLCVQTRVYSPSYVEWLTCFEMARDVREIQERAAKAEAAAPPRRGRTSSVPPVRE